MNLISIDPSKRCTGIYFVINNEMWADDIVNDPNSSNEDVYVKIYKFFVSIFQGYKIDVGLIEDYDYGAHHRGLTVMHEICGIIKLAFAQFAVPLVAIPIMTWKSLTVKKADKKKKDEYLKLVESMYHERLKNVDQADAFLIYQAARKIVSQVPRTDTTKRIRGQLLEIMDRSKGDGNR